ncbi:MAG: TonB-dependent receptor [Pseudomonadota bacterium]
MQIRPQALACAVAIACQGAHAGEDPTRPVSVEVSGSRIEQRRNETASSIVVGHEELVRHGDPTLADALKRLPGITVGKVAGRGSEIRLRGLGNGYTQVLLNGVAAPAGFSFDSLSPELIERVEIIPTASVVLGTQGIAGTINIILRKDGSRARREFKAGAGGQHGIVSPNVSGDVSGKDGSFSHALAATISSNAQLTSVSSAESVADGAGVPALARRTAREAKSRANALNLAPRLSWTFGDSDSLVSQSFVSLMRTREDDRATSSTQLGAPSQYPDNGKLFRLNTAIARSDLTWAHSMAEGRRFELKGGAVITHRRSDFVFDQTGGAALHLVDSGIDERFANLGGKVMMPFGAAHQFTSGWEYARAHRTDSRIETDATRNNAVLDERYLGNWQRWALYGQDEWELASAWSLTAGLRWEALHTHVTGNAMAPVDVRSTVLSPVAQLLYKVAPGDRVRLGVTRTFKAPTMFKLIPRRYTVDTDNSANNPDNQGNPALRPETAWGLDLAYAHDIGKDGTVNASVFARRIKDVTVQQLFQHDATWIEQPANAGRASVHGIAFDASATLSSAVQVRSNVTRNWSRIASIPGPDNRIEGQPPLSGSVGADYKTGALTLGGDFTLRTAGPLRESARLLSYSGVTRELDLYGVWVINGRSRLRVSGANLLRQNQRDMQCYRDADGARSSASETTGRATLRIAYEHRFGG